MRYRAELFVDVWADNKEEAEMLVDIITLSLPNSFQGSISELPHGSKISLNKKEPKCS